MRRSRNFSGRGIKARRPENSMDIFFSPQLILQFTEGVQGFYYRENYTFPRIQRGSNILRVGGQTFSRGVQMLISIEIHITCDFPGGSGPPIPPLDPHMPGSAIELATNCATGPYTCGLIKSNIEINTNHHKVKVSLNHYMLCSLGGSRVC